MADLAVLPTTGTLNNISQVTVDLVNPFTAGLDITQITSSVTSHGISLGTIATATSFTSTGKSSTTSPSLDLNLNFDPAALFTLARILAVEAGEDPTQLDGIVKLGGYSYITATNDDAPSKKREVAVGDNAKRDNIYTYVFFCCILPHYHLISNSILEALILRILLMPPSKNCAPMWNFRLWSALANM